MLSTLALPSTSSKLVPPPIPGIGTFVLDAIYKRDYPVVQAAVLVMATLYMLVNLGIDLLYVVLDPRIREP